MRTKVQREFARWGNADVDVMFDGGGKVRCPACGRRFKFSISRRPIEQGGSHRISGECDCGRVRVWGTAGALFERVPGVDEETEADVA